MKHQLSRSLALVAILTASCSMQFKNPTGINSTTKSSDAVFADSTTLFAGSLNVVSPQGTISTNQPVQWQATVQLNSSDPDSSTVTQYQLTTPSGVDITFSANGAANFAETYTTAGLIVQTATIQAQTAQGNPVGEPVVVTALGFNVVSSGTTSVFSCVTTLSNSPTLTVNTSGTPVGVSTAATYTTICSSAATLLSITGTGGSFTTPTSNGAGTIAVQGTFTTAGYRNVQLNFQSSNSGQKVSTTVSTFVQSVNQNTTPVLSCSLTGNTSATINLDGNSVPSGRSSQVTYTLTANQPFQVSNISTDGGFVANSNYPGSNNTEQFFGTFGVTGNHNVTILIASGNQSVSCYTATAVQGIPTTVQPVPVVAQLACTTTGTTVVSIPVDQNGNPTGRSTEADYVITTNRAGSPVTLSTEGGFVAFYGAAGAGNSFTVKGNFASVGTFHFYLTMADAANGNLQTSCPVVTTVLPSGLQKIDIFRSHKADNSDHLLSQNSNEGPAAGYISDGTDFAVYASATPACGAPLYGCVWGNGRHFASNDRSCEGYTVERFLGWVCAGQAANTQALYRMRDKAGHDHITTTNWGLVLQYTANRGYVYEGPQGFVAAP